MYWMAGSSCASTVRKEEYDDFILIYLLQSISVGIRIERNPERPETTPVVCATLDVGPLKIPVGPVSYSIVA